MSHERKFFRDLRLILPRNPVVYLAVVVVSLVLPIQAGAATVTLDFSDRGSYTVSGSHTPSNLNYLTGLGVSSEQRSFFVFDLATVVAGTITSATLHLFNPFLGFGSTDPCLGFPSTICEPLTIYDVNTPIANVVDGTGGVGPCPAFCDFGTGILYGHVTVSAADNGSFVNITINPAGLAALNSASGLFAFGGALADVTPPGGGVVFRVNGALTTQLILDGQLVPIPAALPLFLTGLAIFGFVARRRRHG